MTIKNFGLTEYFSMKAYKATDKNMQCRGLQFELDKEFVQDGEIKLCERGFHFCERLIDVFNYYRFNPQNRFFEVEIPDDAEIIHGNGKSVTNKIKFTRELSSEDIKGLTDGSNYIDVDGGYVRDKNKYFYNKDGLLHHVDGPAVIYASGGERWYQNGKLHREGAPAVIGTNGYQAWWTRGIHHF